jgi:hypothetical protein
MSEFYNEFELSPEECHVLELWEMGKSMTEAYSDVMIPVYEQGTITKSALNKRVQRFFGTYRMRQAMANSPTERGMKAKADFDKWVESQKEDAIKKFSPKAKQIIKEEKEKNDKEEQESESKKAEEEKKEFSFFDKMVRPNLTSYKKEQEEKAAKEKEEAAISSQRKISQKWIESLNVTEEPNAITVYGTGQFIMYHAVQEINKRAMEIRRKNISVFDKNGSVFTPTILSALKTASAMIIPFAPAPTPEQRRGMSTAIALLGLLQDNIKEDPDDYTAPPPPTIDIED